MEDNNINLTKRTKADERIKDSSKTNKEIKSNRSIPVTLIPDNLKPREFKLQVKTLIFMATCQFSALLGYGLKQYFIGEKEIERYERHREIVQQENKIFNAELLSFVIYCFSLLSFDLWMFLFAIRPLKELNNDERKVVDELINTQKRNQPLLIRGYKEGKLDLDQKDLLAESYDIMTKISKIKNPRKRLYYEIVKDYLRSCFSLNIISLLSMIFVHLYYLLFIRSIYFPFSHYYCSPIAAIQIFQVIQFIFRSPVHQNVLGRTAVAAISTIFVILRLQEQFYVSHYQSGVVLIIFSMFGTFVCKFVYEWFNDLTFMDYLRDLFFDYFIVIKQKES